MSNPTTLSQTASGGLAYTGNQSQTVQIQGSPSRGGSVPAARPQSLIPELDPPAGRPFQDEMPLQQSQFHVTQAGAGAAARRQSADPPPLQRQGAFASAADIGRAMAMRGTSSVSHDNTDSAQNDMMTHAECDPSQRGAAVVTTLCLKNHRFRSAAGGACQWCGKSPYQLQMCVGNPGWQPPQRRELPDGIKIVESGHCFKATWLSDGNKKVSSDDRCTNGDCQVRFFNVVHHQCSHALENANGGTFQ